jgi:hypothetical protein
MGNPPAELVKRYRGINEALSSALAEPDIEVCGYFAVDGSYVDRPNLSPTPGVDFAFDLADPDAELSAIFHSHCSEYQSGFLSHADIESARLNNLATVLYHTKFDVWDYWYPSTWYPWPLTIDPGRTGIGQLTDWVFDYGRSDCGAIVRAYYQRFLGVDLIDFPRGDVGELNDPIFTPYATFGESRGFTPVADWTPHKDLALLRPGDLMIVAIDKVPNHAIVYHDLSTAIHHPGVSHASETTPPTLWVRRCNLVLRHQSQHQSQQ